MEKPSFGKPLEEHLAVSGREIAFPVEACVTMLLECGMQEEVGPVSCHPRLGMMEGHVGASRAGTRNWGALGTSPSQKLVQRSPVSSAKGLFRVAPSASKLKKLKAALDCCVVDVQEYSADPHAIAGRGCLGARGLGVRGMAHPAPKHQPWAPRGWSSVA